MDELIIHLNHDVWFLVKMYSTPVGAAAKL